MQRDCRPRKQALRMLRPASGGGECTPHAVTGVPRQGSEYTAGQAVSPEKQRRLGWKHFMEQCLSRQKHAHKLGFPGQCPIPDSLFSDQVRSQEGRENSHLMSVHWVPGTATLSALPHGHHPQQVHELGADSHSIDRATEPERSNIFVQMTPPRVLPGF